MIENINEDKSDSLNTNANTNGDSPSLTEICNKAPLKIPENVKVIIGNRLQEQDDIDIDGNANTKLKRLEALYENQTSYKRQQSIAKQIDKLYKLQFKNKETDKLKKQKNKLLRKLGTKNKSYEKSAILKARISNISNKIMENDKKIYYKTGSKVIDKNEFSYSSDIDEVIIPNGIIEIKDSAFEHCVSLEKVYFPNTLRRIGKKAFKDCISLSENIYIPPSLKFIGDEAFMGCSLLESIDFINSIDDIVLGKKCFSGCDLLGLYTPIAAINTISALANKPAFIPKNVISLDSNSEDYAYIKKLSKAKQPNLFLYKNYNNINKLFTKLNYSKDKIRESVKNLLCFSNLSLFIFVEEDRQLKNKNLNEQNFNALDYAFAYNFPEHIKSFKTYKYICKVSNNYILNHLDKVQINANNISNNVIKNYKSVEDLFLTNMLNMDTSKITMNDIDEIKFSFFTNAINQPKCYTDFIKSKTDTNSIINNNNNDAIFNIVNKPQDHNLPKTLQHFEQHVTETENTIDKTYEDNTSYEKFKTKFSNHMKKMLSQSCFAMRIRYDPLVNSLQEHFKNQIETNTSGGSLRPNDRKKLSYETFKTPKETAANEFEKFGYLSSINEIIYKDKTNALLNKYGEYTVVFNKNNLKDKTTFTIGDSLTNYLSTQESNSDKDTKSKIKYCASKVTDPKVTAIAPSYLEYITNVNIGSSQQPIIDKLLDSPWPNSPKEFCDFLGKPLREKNHFLAAKKPPQINFDYIELQYHGMLTSDDINMVINSKAPYKNVSESDIKYLQYEDHTI